MPLHILQLRWADYEDAFAVYVDGKVLANLVLVDVLKNAPDLKQHFVRETGIFWNSVNDPPPHTAFDDDAMKPGFKGDVVVGMCGCGVPSCGDWGITMESSDQLMVWSRYVDWRADRTCSITPIVFDRSQYTAEVRAAAEYARFQAGGPKPCP